MANFLRGTSLKYKSIEKIKAKVDSLDESIRELESQINQVDIGHSLKRYKLLIRLKKEKLKGLNYQYLDARAQLETNLEFKNSLEKRAEDLTQMLECRKNSIKRINDEVSANKKNRSQVEIEISETINDLNQVNGHITQKYKEIEKMDTDIESVSVRAIAICREYELANKHLAVVSEASELKTKYSSLIGNTIKSVQEAHNLWNEGTLGELSNKLKLAFEEIENLNDKISELNAIDKKKNNIYEALRTNISQADNLKVELRDTIHARLKNIEIVEHNCNRLMDQLTKTNIDINELESIVKHKREVLGSLRKSFALADYKNEKTKSYWTTLNNEFQEIEQSTLLLERKLEMKKESLLSYEAKVKKINTEFYDRKNFDTYEVLPEDEVEVFLLQTFSNITPNAIVDISVQDNRIKRAIFGVRSLIKYSFKSIIQLSLSEAEGVFKLSVSGRISCENKFRGYMSSYSLLLDKDLINISNIQFEDADSVGIISMEFSAVEESKKSTLDSIALTS